MQTKTKTLVRLTSVLGVTLALAIAGGIMISANAADKKGKKTTIQVKGSDTMVNLAQAWAEAYKGRCLCRVARWNFTSARSQNRT